MAKRMSPPIVYRISFPGGKAYIGITTAELKIRKSEHYSKAKKGPRYAVQNALNKYPKESVIWEILKTCGSFEEAKEFEIKYIKEFNTLSPNGYNLTNGGDGVKGKVFTEEQKKRLSDAHKGYVMPESQKIAIGLAQPKKRPDSFGEKVSAAKKGKKMGKTHLENLIKSRCREFKVFCKNTGTFIGEWLIIKECSEDLNISRTAINNCLNGLSASCGGYIFKRNDQ